MISKTLDGCCFMRNFCSFLKQVVSGRGGTSHYRQEGEDVGDHSLKLQYYFVATPISIKSIKNFIYSWFASSWNTNLYQLFTNIALEYTQQVKNRLHKNTTYVHSWHLQFIPSHCCISFLKLFMEVANFISSLLHR